MPQLAAAHRGFTGPVAPPPAPRVPAASSGGRRFISRAAYDAMHERSVKDPEDFWGEAAEDIVWTRRWNRVLDDSAKPFYRWFPGGELNMCYNAVDRHVDEGNGARTALFYDSPLAGVKRSFTYAELQDEVSRLAGAMAARGVVKGDRVIVYMPMIPEAVFAMLACVRLGAVHSVVFGGFAARELQIRIEDARPSLIMAASCGIEPSHVVRYKALLDEALEASSHKPPAGVLVKQRPQYVAELHEAEQDWDEAVAAASPVPCVPVGSNDPMYILYTSGTTGMPKGVVRDTAGLAVVLRWTMSHFMNTFPGETYWAASDIGWIVGHSYIVYGPLLQGCSTVLYEGKPVGTPDAGAIWRVVEEYKVRGLFLAPTVLRAVRQRDPQAALISKYDISTLRALYVAGERCDPKTSHFFAEATGVPVFDNWWQTETGWPICGFQDDALGRKAGSTSLPMPGYQVVVRSSEPDGEVLQPGEEGDLTVKLPLPPGTFTTVWGGDDRYLKGYMSKYPGFYETGDSGTLDEDGYVTVLERNDDVINVAAHRLSCGATEATIKDHPDVNDCAVVGTADALKGHVPLALIVLQDGVERPHDEILEEVKEKVRRDVGPIATLAACGVVEQLPKTRSGKVLRKNIRGLADGTAFPVPGTIENPAALEAVTEALAAIGYPLAKFKGT